MRFEGRRRHHHHAYHPTPSTTLQEAGVPASRINKVMEGRPHVVDAMLSGNIQLVLNTAKGSGAIKDSFSLRQTALTHWYPTSQQTLASPCAIGAGTGKQPAGSGKDSALYIYISISAYSHARRTSGSSAGPSALPERQACAPPVHQRECASLAHTLRPIAPLGHARLLR